MLDNILVLCTGNICRSPFAEALLRAQAREAGREIHTRSAGLMAATDQPADDLAIAVGRDHGVDLSAHRSQRVTPELLRWADLVLVMEAVHRAELIRIAPTATGKIFLLGHWSGEEIPDPYLEDRARFEESFEMIAAGVDAWLRRI